MVPPDLVLSTLLAQSGASIQQRGVVGAKGYRIIATEAPPVWQTAPKEAPSNTLITTAGGSSAYFRPVKGVTISVPGGGDALRKAVMLKNALRSNCSRMTYTRPVFDIQLQTNLHLETPRLTLLGSPYQQQHNYHQQPMGPCHLHICDRSCVEFALHQIALPRTNFETCYRKKGKCKRSYHKHRKP